MYLEFILSKYATRADTEMTVLKEELFILTDPQKREVQHTIQGHMGKHQG